ncbi:hypothetical protein [Clostridium sp. DJ247]|uniref:hypothetical protein n=1 Tax=Clostridium sp. DJ247 TaxID=2726188 RepID=UPI0016273F3C|nr:hypothetical protein [Clostridium sp. DJ247]MBC2579921.1 hypothetical protein [Clostridium sp. DJ247]
MFSKEIEVEFQYGSESIEEIIRYLVDLKITECERQIRDWYTSSKNIETLMEEGRD